MAGVGPRGDFRRKLSIRPKLDNVSDKAAILAAYTCGICDIEGRDAEVSAGTVLCWNCGEPAVITARISS